jgi:hypothetical protein
MKITSEVVKVYELSMSRTVLGRFRVESTWEGLEKLVDDQGNYMIVMPRTGATFAKVFAELVGGGFEQGMIVVAASQNVISQLLAGGDS